ncbi:MAG: hypothetical protein AAF559_04700 [Pseudomonadota bacterium]
MDDPMAPPDLQYHEFTALLDTGATRTAISQNVISRCGLKPFGEMPVGNVKRTELHSTYLFYIGVWPDPSPGSPQTFYGMKDEILGIDGGDSRYYDVLLGMDVVTQGKLVLNFDKDFELSFPN